MVVSVMKRNEVYVQREHAIMVKKKYGSTPSRIEIKSIYLKGKSHLFLGKYEIDDFEVGKKLHLMSADTMRSYTIARAHYNNSRGRLVIAFQ